jgi:hypothetical protein
MMTTTKKDQSDVLYALALTMPVPDPNTLDKFVRRYPQHAEALTEFAVQLALETGPSGDEDGDGPAEGAVSPAVSRAISHFQNVAFELENKKWADAPVAITNPFASLSTEAFRLYAAKLGANSIFVMKIRDGRIEPESIGARPGFCRVVAEGLNVPIEALMAHVRFGPSLNAQQLHKSDGKPVALKRETFEEAVRSSGLTPEQQRHLLEL